MGDFYYKNEQGGWRVRIGAEQCPEDMLLVGRCQGVARHSGDHWCYRPDGTYAWGVNKQCEESRNNPKNKNTACGWTPPGHKDWVSPVQKADDFYVGHWEDMEVSDPVLISRLDTGDYPDDAIVDQPVTEEDLEWINERLKEHQDADKEPEDV